jgi:hypothetical protein
MADSLTEEQWRALKPPFHWMKVRKTSWPSFVFEMAEKHLYTLTSGWWYHGLETNDYHLFVFERAEDMVAFKLWIASDPFKEEYGEIE